MDTYDVLIVDDDRSNTELVENHFKGSPTIRITVANSAQSAMSVIAASFFHLALVDMQLSPNTPDGMGVFNRLRNCRPSCKAVLLTAFPDVYRKELFTLLNPLFRQIDGAIDKADFSNNARAVIQGLADAWLSNKKSIKGTATIADLLARKMSRNPISVTQSEIDFVLSSIMGQGIDADLSDGIKQDESGLGLLMRTIELKELEGGRSKSVVTAGRPFDDAGNLGIWCVMKIGPRQEIEQEYSRYRSYVHYSVALNHRVELLGRAFADTTGAICYSFAGKSPDSVRSLYEIFKTTQDASQYLHQMFSLENRELYSRNGTKRDLASYFHATYSLDPRKIIRSVEDFLARLKEEQSYSAVLEDASTLNVAGLSAAFVHAMMGTPLSTCIVHGDMNANNVIVSEDGRVIYIDYFRSGCGPRAVDFAALEASLRLATCPDTISGVLEQGKKEDRVWKDQWGPSTQQAIEDSYWGRTSGTLMRYAKINFPDIGASEYAATCLLWGARLFRVNQLAVAEKFRILLWMNQCAKKI